MPKGNIIDLCTYRQTHEIAKKTDISEELKLAIEELIKRLRESRPLDVRRVD
jgi:hypothetical protein